MKAADPGIKEKKSCFIIMPFTECHNGRISLDKTELKYIYENVIRRAVAEYEAENQPVFSSITRYDSKVGSIISGIASNLNEADLVIADLTGMNPNVMYELGVRHTLRRGTIIISQDVKTLPSDLRDFMCVEYRFSKDVIEQDEFFSDFRNDLHKTINELFLTQKFDSPVLSYLKGKERFWREDELKRLKELVVISGYMLEQFDKIKECIEAAKIEKDKNKKTGYFVMINAFLNYLSVSLNHLNIGVETAILYENWQAAIAVISDVRKESNRLDEIAIAEGRYSLLQKRFINHFKLHDNEGEHWTLEEIFTAENDFYSLFMEDVEEYIENKSVELGLSDDDIDHILTN